MGARYIDGVFFNIFAVFSILYLTRYAGIDRTTALWTVCAAAVVMVAFIPLFGHLSDRIGRPSPMPGIIAVGTERVPGFLADVDWRAGIDYSGYRAAFRYHLSNVLRSGSGAVRGSFDPTVRYTGISFVYQFSGIIASGLTPMIATYLMAINNNDPLWVCVYVVLLR